MQITTVTQPLHHPLQAVTKQVAPEGVIVPAIDDHKEMNFLFIRWPRGGIQQHLKDFMNLHAS